MHEITIVFPFPPGRGSGGWGKESTLKAGIAGDQKGKPPPLRTANTPRPRAARVTPLAEVPAWLVL